MVTEHKTTVATDGLIKLYRYKLFLGRVIINYNNNNIIIILCILKREYTEKSMLYLLGSNGKYPNGQSKRIKFCLRSKVFPNMCPPPPPPPPHKKRCSYTGSSCCFFRNCSTHSLLVSFLQSAFQLPEMAGQTGQSVNSMYHFEGMVLVNLER